MNKNRVDTTPKHTIGSVLQELLMRGKLRQNGKVGEAKVLITGVKSGLGQQLTTTLLTHVDPPLPPTPDMLLLCYRHEK